MSHDLAVTSCQLVYKGLSSYLDKQEDAPFWLVVVLRTASQVCDSVQALSVHDVVLRSIQVRTQRNTSSELLKMISTVVRLGIPGWKFGYHFRAPVCPT